MNARLSSVAAATARNETAVAAPTSVGIPLLPLQRLHISLECLAPVRTGLFPEASLASLLMAAQDSHKESLDTLSLEVARGTRHHYARGETFDFLLQCSQRDTARRDAVLALLSGLPGNAPRPRDSSKPGDSGSGSNKFGDNWRLAAVRQLDGGDGLDEAQLRAEAQHWHGVERFRLRFVSPLRIRAGQSGTRGRLRYCRRESELDDAALTAALTNSLVGLKFALDLREWTIPPLPLRILRKELFLVDPGRRSLKPGAKPLDEGLLGEVLVEWAESPTECQLQHLLLLQYIGAGQGRAFGLGRLQLEQLDGKVTKSVLPARAQLLALASDEGNLVLACEHVRRREDLRPWPGLTADRHDEDAQETDTTPYGLLNALSRRLADATVMPTPLFPLRLPKPDGGERELLIPSFADRIAQRAVLQSLEPALDALFAENSFGFRRGLGREAARDRILLLQRQGFGVVAETDVRRFFDEVAWWRLETRLRCLFGEDSAVTQIMRWVEAARTDGLPRSQGLPQGAALSPILSNLMLDNLDRVLAHSGCHLVRFADDFVILCKTPAEAAAALETTACVLADSGLRLKLEKTRITDFRQGFRFLGFQFVGSLAVPVAPEAQPAATLPADLQALLTPPPEPCSDVTQLDSNGEEPGQLLVINETGSSLSLDGGRLRLKRRDGSLEYFNFAALSSVLLAARAQLSTEVIKAALRAQVPLHFLSATGQWQGSTAGEADAETLALWQQQQQRAGDMPFQLSFARQIVVARLQSMITVLSHRRAGASAVAHLQQLLRQANDMTSLDGLRGIEGRGTARYFAALDELLPDGFDFKGRTRRPPRDPVNALLSLGYTLLHHAAHAVLSACRLNPRIGIYHQPRGRHAALASDFVEPFRFIVERQVLSQLNRHEFRPGDFIQRGDGACLLASPARARFVLSMQARFQEPLRARESACARGLYGHLHWQAESFRRALASGGACWIARFR